MTVMQFHKISVSVNQVEFKLELLKKYTQKKIHSREWQNAENGKKHFPVYNLM